jgi:hypothetical protein
MPRSYDEHKARSKSRQGVSIPKRGRGTARGRGKACPTPDKLDFPSRDSADNFLKYAHYEGRTARPHRSYLCPCGQWHTSSKETY